MYTLENINGKPGYKISWEELDNILDCLYPYRRYGNGWYDVCSYSSWKKEDEEGKILHDRIYIKLKQYKKRELKKEDDLGYYDNILNAYFITNRMHKVTDVIDVYQKKEV